MPFLDLQAQWGKFVNEPEIMAEHGIPGVFQDSLWGVN